VPGWRSADIGASADSARPWPLRPAHHVAFGSSTDNIYVARESSEIIVVDGETFERVKRINTGTSVGGALLVSQHNKLYCSYPQQGRMTTELDERVSRL
jgi:hypothetical protein